MTRGPHDLILSVSWEGGVVYVVALQYIVYHIWCHTILDLRKRSIDVLMNKTYRHYIARNPRLQPHIKHALSFLWNIDGLYHTIEIIVKYVLVISVNVNGISCAA